MSGITTARYQNLSTTAEIMAAVEKLKATAPAAERCESMQANRATAASLKREADPVRLATFCGLPLRINDALPNGVFCLDMADGSKIVHDGENTYKVAAEVFDPPQWILPRRDV